VIAGVAGGIAHYFDVDPTLVRIAIVVLTVLTGGVFAIFYVAAIVVMPRGDGEPAPLGQGVPASASTAVAIVFGLILIAIGATALMQTTDLPEAPWDAMLAIVLTLIGLAILFEARHGAAGGLVAVAIVLTAVLAVTTSIPSVRWDSGFGDRTERPANVAALADDYSHSFGSMSVDLRDIDFPDGTTRVEISIAFGDLTVRVPAGVAVRVTGRTVFGSSDVLGRAYDGINASVDVRSSGYDAAAKHLDIELSNAFGSATVR
jgi:phage shock protein PspC (stress-responsive transcriptional regulator)/predicted membrane protein